MPAPVLIPTAKAGPQNMRWPYVRLGDVAKTSSGGTPKRTVSAYYGGGIPWIKSGELGDSTVYETSETISKTGLEGSSAKIFPKGTLCVALYGATVGKLGILGVEAATNQAVCGIFLPPEIDTRFAYRFLESKRRQLAESAKGGAQPNISQEIIRDLQFPIPTLDEQRRIVAEIEKQFTRLDAGIAALRRTQANLKRYRAGVLKAACEGWPSCPLSSVCEVVSGYAFRSSDFCDTGIPVVKIANVSYGSFSDDTPSFLPRNFLPEFHRFTVRAGDILLALTRPITNNQVKTCLYPKELPDALHNQRVAKLVPTDRIVRGYLLAYLRSEHFKSAITARMPQTLQPNLSPRDLSAMPIPLPPFDEQTRIVAEVERRLSVVEELEAVLNANLQRATRLRQSILSKAFSQ